MTTFYVVSSNNSTFLLFQNGVVGAEASQQAVVVGCRTALTLAPLQRSWEAALARMLAHHQVRGGGGAAGHATRAFTN